MLPVINKVGGSVDRVNAQLDKLDQVTDSAASAVEAVDQAVRTVSSAVKRPAQKAAGVAAGVSHGWSRFCTSRNWRDAVDEARAAAARREQDIEDELSAAVRCAARRAVRIDDSSPKRATVRAGQPPVPGTAVRSATRVRQECEFAWRGWTARLSSASSFWARACGRHRLQGGFREAVVAGSASWDAAARGESACP